MSTQHSHNPIPIHQHELEHKGLTAFFWQHNLWIIMVLTITVMCASAWFIDDNNNQAYLQQKRAEVQNKLSTLRAQLEGHLSANIQAVNGLVAAISVEPNMTQERFALFAGPLIKNNNQLRNIAAAPNMTIRLMHPMQGNEKAIGLNYLEHEKQRQSAITARDTGKLVLAGPVDLMQGGKGFIGRIPVFSENIAPGKRIFWGLVSAVIDVDALYRASGLYDKNISLELAIFGHDKRFSDGSTFYGDDAIFNKQPVVSIINLPFGTWQLAAIPKKGWPTAAKDAWSLRLIILLISLCILAPVMSLVSLNNRHRNQQLRLNALFQLSPIGIALNDFETGEYININKQLTNDTGYNLKQLQASSNRPLSPKKNISFETPHKLELINTGLCGPYEQEYINANGDHYPVRINTILIKDSNGKNLTWSYIENITLQKNTEKQLFDNLRQFELVINATQVGIWDWQVQSGELSINARWAEIIGYSLDELGEISIDTWLNHTHKADLEESGKRLEAHWNSQTESYSFESRMQHKNGHIVWVLDTGKVIEWQDDGKPKRMVGTHLDITEKKRVEKILEKNKATLESQMLLINTIAKAQSDFIQNSNFIQAVNSLLEGLNELTNSELSLIGNVYYENGIAHIKMISFNATNPSDFQDNLTSKIRFSDLLLSRKENIFVEAVNTQQPIYINDLENDNRNFKYPEHHPTIHNVMAIPIIQKGVCIGIIGMANCINKYDSKLITWLSPLINTVGQIIERVSSIEEKQKTDQKLLEAKEEAESAGRAKTDFLATMSHEIRTPMNGVLGMLTLLQKSQLTPEQSRKIDIAKVSADSLLSIINDVLDFTKIESGKLTIEKIEFNIRETIDDVCQSMALRAQEKGLELIIDSSEITTDWIISDPVRIRQVLTNLIGNANKFTHQGEITIKSSTNLINGIHYLRCEIIDTGIGIPKNKADKLFTSFTQADASTTRKYGGTGLGLSISKRLCELMGGKIGFESTENSGSCFSFELPINTATKTNHIPSNISDLQILIVDPNTKSCNALAMQLKKWNNNPSIALTADDAKHQMTKHDHFDLIIINHLQGNTNGLNLGAEIRKQFPHINSQLVLMTNINQAHSDQEINEAGFNIHFSKPLTSNNLRICLDALQLNQPHRPSSEENQQIQLPPNTRLLLVEDIPFNQEVAIMLLAEMGVNADIANNGQEAVEKVKLSLQSANSYDVILMDCQMPIMDGYDATRAIRKLENHTDQKLCIIAMTANAMNTDKEKCLACGMDDYLTKPIDENQLFQTLSKWLTTQ